VSYGIRELLKLEKPSWGLELVEGKREGGAEGSRTERVEFAGAGQTLKYLSDKGDRESRSGQLCVRNASSQMSMILVARALHMATGFGFRAYLPTSRRHNKGVRLSTKGPSGK